METSVDYSPSRHSTTEVAGENSTATQENTMQISYHLFEPTQTNIPVALINGEVWFPLHMFVDVFQLGSAHIVYSHYVRHGRVIKKLKFVPMGSLALAVTANDIRSIAAIAKTQLGEELLSWAARVKDSLSKVDLIPEVLPAYRTDQSVPTIRTGNIKRSEEVQVCGSTVLAVVDREQHLFFSPRHVCAALGIDWAVQFKKIKADQILNTCVVEMTTQLPGDSQAREFTLLPIEYLTGWLFTIRKASPAAQKKLNAFRAEGYKALDYWFRKQTAPPAIAQSNEALQSKIDYLEQRLLSEQEKNLRLELEVCLNRFDANRGKLLNQEIEALRCKADAARNAYEDKLKERDALAMLVLQ